MRAVCALIAFCFLSVLRVKPFTFQIPRMNRRPERHSVGLRTFSRQTARQMSRRFKGGFQDRRTYLRPCVIVRISHILKYFNHSFFLPAVLAFFFSAFQSSDSPERIAIKRLIVSSIIARAPSVLRASVWRSLSFSSNTPAGVPRNTISSLVPRVKTPVSFSVLRTRCRFSPYFKQASVMSSKAPSNAPFT